MTVTKPPYGFCAGVKGTAAEIVALTGYPEETLGWATDTGAFYLFDGTTWQGPLNTLPVSVTDGTTTVVNVVEVDFTSGATVTDAGGGVAQVAITGGGGSGGRPTQLLRLDTPAVGNNINGSVVGVTGEYDGQAGGVIVGAAFQSGPLVFGAASAVLDLRTVQGHWVATVGASPVLTDYTVACFVTDATGTNIATATRITTGTPTTGLFTQDFDGTGGTWTVVAGTDLTSSSETLSTTAGGVYFVTAQVTVEPD